MTSNTSATYASFLQAVDHLPGLYGVVPGVVAHDLHPEYLSTKFALELDRPLSASTPSCPRRLVPRRARSHGPVLAICFDGLGYGTDGSLGEVSS